jgi:hypothetical protein
VISCVQNCLLKLQRALKIFSKKWQVISDMLSMSDILYYYFDKSIVNLITQAGSVWNI